MRRVLVVDDEPICTTLLSLTLAEKGFDVRTAGNGEEAIAIGGEFRPHVLVSDWKLTNVIDGVEVARVLQRAEPALVVILFSGLPADQLIAKAEGLCLFRVLEKPCGIDDIPQLIDEALEGSVPAVP